MARNLRDIRRKMKAIKSTKQVTKAMELVSAAKMRKAVQNAQMLRQYALTAWNILNRIAQVHPDVHPYLAAHPVERVLVVLFTSDRGLCGSLNAQMLRLTQGYIKSVKERGIEKVDFVAIGKKGQQYLARTQQHVIAAFPALSNHPKFKDALAIVRLAAQEYLNGHYDQVVLLYPDCVSALRQEPTAKTLLPLSKTDLQAMIEELLPRKHSEERSEVEAEDVHEFLFEPSPEEVLRTVIPQLTEIQLYQAVLESTASEHSARMVAMRNATDSASDLLDDLTLVYNQTRQAGITAELAELSASAAALS